MSIEYIDIKDGELRLFVGRNFWDHLKLLAMQSTRRTRRSREMNENEAIDMATLKASQGLRTTTHVRNVLGNATAFTNPDPQQMTLNEFTMKLLERIDKADINVGCSEFAFICAHAYDILHGE